MATDIIARGMITEYIAGTNINFTENRDGTVEISASGSLSSEDSVARDAIGNHKSDTSNPHNVTPTQIGLGNVDNTSDLDKPISTAVQKAIDNKADKTVATTSADGLMSSSDKNKLDSADDTYALKSKYGDTTINVGRKAGTDIGTRSTAEGFKTTASGNDSHAEGSQTTASDGCAHAEGYKTTASGTYSHAEGSQTIASGDSSHAEGSQTTANSHFSHAEGWETTTNGGNSCHAEGYQTTASGFASHVEGRSNNKVIDLIPDFSLQTITDEEIINTWNTQQFSLAHGDSSHVEGSNNLALGGASHAEGTYTIAMGKRSHTSGCYTKALHDDEAAYGKYNVSNEDTLFSIGDGTADDARHNAFEITATGGKLHDKDIATTDLIPTELPANGGNADTVDGMHVDSFIYPRAYLNNVDLNTILYPCSALARADCTNIPISTSWGTLLCYSGGTGSHVQLWVTATDSSMFKRHYNGERWSDWKEISTTPIKKMTFPNVAIYEGGGGVFFSIDYGTPIAIACTSRRTTQCTQFVADDTWYVLAKDAVTLDPIPAGSYSFDVWYI